MKRRAFRTDGTYGEIVMARENVEALRDQLPKVLAGLDRWAAEEAACGHACRAEKRAVVAETTDKANAVDATTPCHSVLNPWAVRSEDTFKSA
jgi:hypothetical protein